MMPRLFSWWSESYRRWRNDTQASIQPTDEIALVPGLAEDVDDQTATIRARRDMPRAGE
jgi:hypothetical protein